MSSGARHAIGAGVGLVAIPVILFALPYFGGIAHRQIMMFLDFTPQALGAALAVLAISVALGGLAGSRLSPLAALIPGIAVMTFGALSLFPATVHLIMGITGPANPMLIGPMPFLIVGGVLTGSALLPSRWRDAPAGASAPYPPYPPYAGQLQGDAGYGGLQQAPDQGRPPNYSA